jgi:AraC-like DNA-binding protein
MNQSFIVVLDEARHQMARYYLSNSKLKLIEAAYFLGFEDPNSSGHVLRITDLDSSRCNQSAESVAIPGSRLSKHSTRMEPERPGRIV